MPGGKRGNFVANDFGLFCGFAVAKKRMQLGEMSWKTKAPHSGYARPRGDLANGKLLFKIKELKGSL